MKDNCASLTAREPKLESRSDSAQPPAGLSEGHATRPRIPPAHKEGGLRSQLAHQRLPSLSPSPRTARLLLPSRRRAKPTAGFAAQKAPTAKPGYRSIPGGELRGERCPFSAHLPNPGWCTAPKEARCPVKRRAEDAAHRQRGSRGPSRWDLGFSCQDVRVAAGRSKREEWSAATAGL